jgi:hypothetical protein
MWTDGYDLYHILLLRVIQANATKTRKETRLHVVCCPAYHDSGYRLKHWTFSDTLS